MYNFPVAEILSSGLLGRLPVEWWDPLRRLSLDDLRKLPRMDSKGEWPASLEEMARRCASLRLPVYDQPLAKASTASWARTPSALRGALTRGMSPKKDHEVLHLAAYISERCRRAGVGCVVDMGCGIVSERAKARVQHPPTLKKKTFFSIFFSLLTGLPVRGAALRVRAARRRPGDEQGPGGEGAAAPRAAVRRGARGRHGRRAVRGVRRRREPGARGARPRPGGGRGRRRRPLLPGGAALVRGPDPQRRQAVPQRPPGDLVRAGHVLLPQDGRRRGPAVRRSGRRRRRRGPGGRRGEGAAAAALGAGRAGRRPRGHRVPPGAAGRVAAPRRPAVRPAAAGRAGALLLVPAERRAP
ncbi:hypothetical protein ONE63_004793 [Megalurothrips usitatus]|uniref:Uncharacterized protein n=1 Tax=Megalurothrips usitatus TaxID=439358 RepID=A0AAV7X7K9_9NEOP|nr:hypothetical protein ONE63_004793 [Megalurothrips usitatus]